MLGFRAMTKKRVWIPHAERPPTPRTWALFSPRHVALLMSHLCYLHGPTASTRQGRLLRRGRGDYAGAPEHVRGCARQARPRECAHLASQLKTAALEPYGDCECGQDRAPRSQPLHHPHLAPRLPHTRPRFKPGSTTQHARTLCATATQTLPDTCTQPTP